MINDRPSYLTDDPSYAAIPPLPIGLDLRTVPNWVKLSMLFLGGVQPITQEMIEAAGFIVEDRPSPGEIDLFRQRETRFQIISVVTSVAAFREVDGVHLGVPYAISLVPASKRGAVSSNIGAEYVRQIDLNVALQEQEPCFVDFNPFNGQWGAWGPVSFMLGQKPWSTYPDGIGLVTDMYFLQIGADLAEIPHINLGMSEGKPLRKYLQHRNKLMFTPFEAFRARRVWGAESPIELFLLQALLRENLAPLLQISLFEDGSTHPSLYDLWAQDLRDVPGLITEADMFFPEQRLAVFCDSTKHHRGQKAALKDAAISAKLLEAGFKSVRVPGSMIVKDLKEAAKLVLSALD